SQFLDRRAALVHSSRPRASPFQGCRKRKDGAMSPSRTRGCPARRIASRFRRRGTAVVELAVLIALLVLIFVIASDFARVFYVSLTLTNCARAGALYASDPTTADESPFASAQAAALADATNLSPQPTITSTSGIDGQGRAYVSVTAKYT